MISKSHPTECKIKKTKLTESIPELDIVHLDGQSSSIDRENSSTNRGREPRVNTSSDHHFVIGHHFKDRVVDHHCQAEHLGRRASSVEEDERSRLGVISVRLDQRGSRSSDGEVLSDGVVASRRQCHSPSVSCKDARMKGKGK